LAFLTSWQGLPHLRTAEGESDYDFAILFKKDTDILNKIKLALDVAEA